MKKPPLFLLGFSVFFCTRIYNNTGHKKRWFHAHRPEDVCFFFLRL
jgi:hypothetical protein